jgi:hypothetical protein
MGWAGLMRDERERGISHLDMDNYGYQDMHT